MKKAPKAVPSSAKKKHLKSPVKPAKRPSNGNPTKARRQPSNDKKEGARRNAVQSGVLAKLRPPLPFEIKRPKPDLFNPFAQWYNRPNEYLAYGAFHLLYTIYGLKIHWRPIPLDAIKVLENAIEDISQQKAEILINDWAVEPKEARKIVDSSHRAWLIQFSKKVWGSSNPEEDFKDGGSCNKRERAMMASSKHDFDELLKVLKSDLVGKSGSNPEAIFERTYRVIKEKTTGFEAWRHGSNDWVQKIVCLWVAPPWGDGNGKWPKKMPPVCMWSSDAITKLLVDAEFKLSDEMVRQSIKRLGLCRPSQQVPTFGVSSWVDKITFVRRVRGRFDS